MFWIVALSACEYLTETRVPPEEVSYAGTILQGPGYEEAMSGGAVAFYDLEGALIDEASEPYSDSPGYWYATLPVDTDFQLTIDGGEGYYPGLWRGVSPEGTGYWYTGTYFAWPADLVDAYLAEFASIAGLGGLTSAGFEPLADGEVAHLWGYLWEPDAVDPSALEVLDAEGEPVELYAFEAAEDGSLSLASAAPAHYFVAFDLSPGDVTVTYAGEPLATWTAAGGEVITPWWFLVP